MKVLTRTHRGLDLATIRADQIHQADLRALVGIGRFVNQTAKFWSVAQHSLNVARVTKDLGGDANAQAWALLHDAHEAYFGDVIRPMIAFLGDAAGAKIDWLRQRVDAAIAERFQIRLDTDTIRVVEEADEIVLAAEILLFFPAETSVLLEIPAVKRRWPLVQYVPIEVVESKVWLKQMEALWPASAASADHDTPVGAA